MVKKCKYVFKYFSNCDIILVERYGENMASRMERYYKSSEIKTRSDKNKELYRTIYDEVEYSNVEGISVIEKNEKIDLDMIRQLVNGNSPKKEVKPPKEERIEPVIEPTFEEKNYDIREVLDKAKSERSDKERKFSNTQYNILKDLEASNKSKEEPLDEDKLKSMIEAISYNSKSGYTTDLLDDLKSIHDPNIKQEIESKLNKEEKDLQDTKAIDSNIDRSFFTSSLDLTSADFEDLKEIKENVRKNNVLTRVLLFVLSVVVVTGIIFLIYHFTQ